MQNKVTLFCKVTVKTTDRQQERRFFLHFFRFRKAVIFSKTERKVTGLPACNFLTNSMGIHYLCTRIPTKRPAVFRRGRRPEREHRGGAGESRSEPGSHREPPGATGSHREPPGATGSQTGGADRKDRKAAGEGLPGEPGRAEAKRKATGSQTGPLKERRETSGNNGTPSGDDETPSGNAGGGQLRTGVRHHERTKPHKKIRL